MKIIIIITFSLGFLGGGKGGRVTLGWAFSYMLLYTPSNFKGLCFKETQHSNSVKMGLVLCGYLLPWYTHKTISKCLSGIFVNKNNLLFIIKVLGIFPLKKNDVIHLAKWLERTLIVVRSNWKLLTSDKSAHNSVRFHNLDAGDTRGVVGEIASYHKRD